MSYEVPEIYELGDAEELTLGSCGGNPDWCGYPLIDIQGCEPPCGVYDEPTQAEERQ